VQHDRSEGQYDTDDWSLICLEKLRVARRRCDEWMWETPMPKSGVTASLALSTNRIAWSLRVGKMWAHWVAHEVEVLRGAATGARDQRAGWGRGTGGIRPCRQLQAGSPTNSCCAAGEAVADRISGSCWLTVFFFPDYPVSPQLSQY